MAKRTPTHRKWKKEQGMKRAARRFKIVLVFTLLLCGALYVLFPEQFVTTLRFIIKNPDACLLLSAAGIIGVFMLARLLKRRKYRNSSLSKIDVMTGEEFELWLKYYFEEKGYKVALTPKSGDFGADLVLTSRSLERTVVQAKRYKGRVGIEAVQQVIASKAYYKATKSIVATNSYFTDAARELAKANGVILMDRKYFFKVH